MKSVKRETGHRAPRAFIAAAALAAVTIAGCQTASTPRPEDYRSDVAESRNMRLLGHVGLQGRSAYQPVVHQQGGRFIAYVGHHGGKPKLNPMTGAIENNGTTLIDVTNPAAPRELAHLPGMSGGTESGGAQMVRLCNGSQLPNADRSKVYMLRSFGNSAHEMWDVTSPEKPVMLNIIIKGLRDTHKSWWECDTGIAYLVSGVPGWKSRRMTQIYDLSNPAKPVHIRDFGLEGQEPTAKTESTFELHGPISTGPKGNRIYFGYGTARFGVIQIVDREKLLKGPKEPTVANLLYPQVSRVTTPPNWGAHTTLPVLGMNPPELEKFNNPKHRDILVVVNESTSNECREGRQMAYIMDITTEATPYAISNFRVPEADGNFCTRGGRFGAHSSNENMPPMYAQRVVFMTWFNAGVRAVDIRDPYSPKEIGYFIPAITAASDTRCVKDASGQESCKKVIQSNNVDVDDRGYIYVVDRADNGMHILELTGDARNAANFK
jgi:hypothetical protein